MNHLLVSSQEKKILPLLQLVFFFHLRSFYYLYNWCSVDVTCLEFAPSEKLSRLWENHGGISRYMKLLQNFPATSKKPSKCYTQPILGNYIESVGANLCDRTYVIKHSFFSVRTNRMF